MNKKIVGVFWGLLMIAGGLYALAQTMGYKTLQNPTAWAFIFGGISLVSLVFYLFEGVNRWGWLFPVGVFAALATTLGLEALGVENAALGAPIFVGVGIPFVAAYLVDRAKNWWAPIPAGIMAFLTLMIFMVDNMRDEWIGSGFLFIVAVIFFLAYLNRRALWAAITAYVFFVLGFMPLMAMTTRPELAGILLFIALGLPFLFIYFQSAERWWAIIPAGILLTMGVVTAIILLPGIPSSEYDPRFANSIIFAGMTATFAVLWLRHHKDWGMVLTAVSALMAIAALFFSNINNTWSLFVVAAGVYVLYSSLRPKAA